MAARSSRAMLGDLAGLPLLMNAPCSHCEQISTRGSDAAVAPICPQCGQTTRVSMNVTTAARRARPQELQGFVNSSGSLAMLAAMRRASLRVSLAATYAVPPIADIPLRCRCATSEPKTRKNF